MASAAIEWRGSIKSTMYSHVVLDDSAKTCGMKRRIKSYLTNGAWQAQCDIGIAAVKTSSHSLSHALNMKS